MHDQLKPSYRGDGPGHTVSVEVSREKYQALIRWKDKETGEDNAFRKWCSRPVKITWRWNGKDWELKEDKPKRQWVK